MGRKSKRSRSRSRSPMRSGGKSRDRAHGSSSSSRHKDERHSASHRRRHSRSRSSSSDEDDKRRRSRRYSSSSSSPSPEPSHKQRTRDKEPRKKAEPKQSTHEKSQARISSLLEKTDQKYKALQTQQKEAPAPSSAILADLESEEFAPQSFTSSRAQGGREDGGGGKNQGDQEGIMSHDSHMDAIYGSKKDTTAGPLSVVRSSGTEEAAKSEGITTNDGTVKTDSQELLSDSDRMSMWLSRLQTLRTKYKPVVDGVSVI